VAGDTLYMQSFPAYSQLLAIVNKKTEEITVFEIRGE